MQANEYYITTADTIYGLMRKSIVYVTKIRKKTFCYQIVDWYVFTNWVANIRVDKLKIIKHSGNHLGKLVDAPYFEIVDKMLIDASNITTTQSHPTPYTFAMPF